MASTDPNRYPGIPEPGLSAEDMRRATSLIKEGLEIMQGLRGDPLNRVPTYDELLRFGIILQEDYDSLIGRT